jgi:hypothetical protein
MRPRVALFAAFRALSHGLPLARSRPSARSVTARSPTATRLPARLGRYVVLAVVSGACASPAPHPSYDAEWQTTPGTDPSSPEDRHPKAIPEQQRQRWSRAAELEGLQPVGGRGPSDHLGGMAERSVRINQQAEAYRRLGREPLPTGALVVQLHYPPASSQLITVFVMEKMPRGSIPNQHDWAYLVLDAKLRVESRGPLPLCASCHLTAPHDSLFGPPQDLESAIEHSQIP